MLSFKCIAEDEHGSMLSCSSQLSYLARRLCFFSTMASLVASYKPVVIFLHGSGDTGRGAEQWVRSLAAAKELAEFEWHFPDAEIIPYTLAGGAPTSVWYDRAGGFDPHFPEQTASVEASCRKILGLVEGFVARGVRSGVAHSCSRLKVSTHGDLTPAPVQRLCS